VKGALALACLLSAGWSCSHAEPRAATEKAPPAAPVPRELQPAAEKPPEIFGAPSQIAGQPLDVEQVLAAPNSYLKQTIKCQGTVSRVCEAAGCWLELSADAGGAGLRVPMAGHSFFVPQRIVGKRAIVEGTLTARELSQTELAHLRGEGLQATGPLFLAATSVTVTSEPSHSR
jgi:hypothetical protein